MIGTQDMATRAVAGELDVLSLDGSTRIVYIGPDNVVYKVCNGMESWGYDINAHEFEVMSDSSNLPDGVFYPEVALYHVGNMSVIAMEYISGQPMSECYCVAPEVCMPDCMTPYVWERVNGVMDDTGGFNVIVNHDGIYIIDQG